MLMLLIDRTLLWTQEAPITLSLFELEPNWCPIIDIAMDWCNRHVQAPTSLSQLCRHHRFSGLVVNTQGMIFRLWLQSRVRKIRFEMTRLQLHLRRVDIVILAVWDLEGDENTSVENVWDIGTGDGSMWVSTHRWYWRVTRLGSIYGYTWGGCMYL